MTVEEYYNTSGFYLDEDDFSSRVARHAAAVISVPGNGGSVLDVGCGTGGMFQELINCGAYEITGIDVSQKMINEAMENWHDGRVSIFQKDFMDFEDVGYDLVISFNSYNNFSDPEAFVKKAHSVLNKNGRLCVAHSHGKDRTNAISRVMPEGVCRQLLAPWKELKYWDNYFRVDSMIDNDRIFLLSGTMI